MPVINIETKLYATYAYNRRTKSMNLVKRYNNIELTPAQKKKITGRLKHLARGSTFGSSIYCRCTAFFIICMFLPILFVSASPICFYYIGALWSSITLVLCLILLMVNCTDSRLKKTNIMDFKSEFRKKYYDGNGKFYEQDLVYLLNNNSHLLKVYVKVQEQGQTQQQGPNPITSQVLQNQGDVGLEVDASGFEVEVTGMKVKSMEKKQKVDDSLFDESYDEEFDGGVVQNYGNLGLY